MQTAAATDRPFNILIDDLPETIIVNGRSFSIDTDFRTMIMFELMLLDSTMSETEKAMEIIDLFFIDDIPTDPDETAKQLQFFYACGHTPKQEPRRRRRGKQQPEDDSKPERQPPAKRVYDFQEDAELIYAAFLSQYGVDLNEIEYLHWWKFMAMFQGLHEDNQIVKIIGYRSVDLSKIKDKDTRNRYAELKRKYALHVNMTSEQKVSMAGNAFSGGLPRG